MFKNQKEATIPPPINGVTKCEIWMATINGGKPQRVEIRTLNYAKHGVKLIQRIA